MDRTTGEDHTKTFEAIHRLLVLKSATRVLILLFPSGLVLWTRYFLPELRPADIVPVVLVGLLGLVPLIVATNSKRLKQLEDSALKEPSPSAIEYLAAQHIAALGNKQFERDRATFHYEKLLGWLRCAEPVSLSSAKYPKLTDLVVAAVCWPSFISDRTIDLSVEAARVVDWKSLDDKKRRHILAYRHRGRERCPSLIEILEGSTPN